MAEFIEPTLSESDETDKKCEVCAGDGKNSKALKFCKECSAVLCAECTDAHVPQSHCLLEITEITEEKDSKTEDKIKCEPCLNQSKDEVGLVFCKDCEEYMCTDCSSVHLSQKITKSHQQIPADQMKAAEKADADPDNLDQKKCEPCLNQNKHEDASMFCKDCEEYMCTDCSSVHLSQKITKSHQQIPADQMKAAEKADADPDNLDQKKCEPCLNQNKHEDASMFCKDCEEYMCTDCSSVHLSQKITKSHQQIPADQMKAAEKADADPDNLYQKKCEPCSNQNKREDAAMFCKDCEEYLCRECSSVHSSQKITKFHQQISADQIKTVESRPCEPCFENGNVMDAIKYCTDCEEALCEKCAISHKSQKATKNHKPIDISDLSIAKQSDKTCEPCQENKKEMPASQVCIDCEEFLCTTCAKVHKTQKATKGHKQVNAADLPVIVCDPCSEKRENRPAGKMCIQCDEAMCTPCVTQHSAQKATRNHRFEEIHLSIADLKLCDPCGTGNKEELSTKFCDDCEEYYCTSCSEAHTTQKVTRKHKLVDHKHALAKKETSQQASASQQGFQRKEATTSATPSQPKATDTCIKSDSVTIHWQPPSNFQESSCYQIRYKEKGKKWQFHQEQPDRASVTIDKLQAKTAYIFQVRVITDDEEGPYSPESAEIVTKSSLASRLLPFCTKSGEGSPAVYQLHSTENRRARNDEAKTRKFELGQQPIVGQKEKTILLVGATGSGKSTLVDGIINYVTGVNWKDPYRFSLINLEAEEKNKNQAVSQTEWITCYTINPEEGSRLDYRLNIIDTPGFGDTRGLERDNEIVRQLKELFSAKDEKGVVFIDAVCFLIKAPDARLTAVQKYIFLAIQSLFGKDIGDNICMLVTFADGNDPPVLVAMKEAELPYSSWYVFNNSGLFAPNVENQTSLAPMFWDMGIRSFKQFFDSLEKMPTKSLQQTQQVLHERERLEVTIQNLQPQVDAGLNKVAELKQEIDILSRHEKDIKDNENFEYEVDETRQIKTDLPRGQHTTNCLHCHVTCHQNCALANDEDKARCVAMDNEGYCTVCDEHCHWQQHANTPYIFSFETVKVKKTYEEKLKMYKKAGEQKVTHEQVINRMMDELGDLNGTIQDMMEEVNDCNNVLKTIALRPNPLTMVEHIDLMINGEKMEKKDGFQDRIKVLQNYRKKADIHKDVSKLREEFQTTTRSRPGQYRADGTTRRRQYRMEGTQRQGNKTFWKQFKGFFYG